MGPGYKKSLTLTRTGTLVTHTCIDHGRVIATLQIYSSQVNTLRGHMTDSGFCPHNAAA